MAIRPKASTRMPLRRGGDTHGNACRLQLLQPVERLLEAAGVGSFGFGEGLEPLRDLDEVLAASGFGHARIHLRVLEGLTGHGGSQIHVGGADRLVRRRITGGLQEVEVAVGMPGLGLGGVAKQAPDVGIALDVRLPRE